MKAPMAIRVALVLNLALALVSCTDQSTKSKPSPKTSEPATFDSALLSNFTAVLDGGAYASGFGGVWYLRGAEATPVREVGTPSTPAPAGQRTPEGEKGSNVFDQQLLLEITPALDGGAYAKSLTGGVWFLRGTEAIRIKEVPALSGSLSMTSVTGHEKRIFVLAQYQASKLARCEGGK